MSRKLGWMADGPRREDTPTWVKAFGVVALIVVLLFVVLLLVKGPGGHGPGRHTGALPALGA
jgi:hypothetical protein